MKVMLVGEKEEFTKVLLERINKEGDEAYFLAKEDFPFKDKVHTKHKYYCLDIKNEILNIIFESVKPDVVIFSGGKYMGAQDVAEYRWESDGYLQLLEKILQNISRFPLSKFIYLSNTTVYGNENKICKENTMNHIPSILGLTMAAGEYMVKQYGKTYGIQTHILRSSPLYGDVFEKEQHDFLNQWILNLLSQETIYIKKNSFLQPLHIKDFVDAIFRVIENGKEEIYNVTSDNIFLVKDGYQKLMNLLEIQKEIIELPEEKISVMDDAKIRKELEWMNLHTLEERFLNEKSFKKLKKEQKREKEKKNKQMKRKIPTAVRHVCENIVVFAVFFLLYYASQSNTLFMKVDWLLIYVMLISVCWGLRQSLLAILCASLAYLFMNKVNFLEMSNFYSYAESTLMIAEFILLGIIISYTIDVLKENIRDEERKYKILRNDYGQLRKINRENVVIKEEYEKRLLVSQSGIPTLYSLIKRLMVSSSDKVLVETMNIISERMETNTVAIYFMNMEDSKLFLINALNRESRTERKRWNILLKENIKDAIENDKIYEGDIWNNEPAYLLPIRYKEKQKILIVVKEVPYTSHTLYHLNLLRTLHLMINDFMSQALHYENHIRNRRYIRDTDILVSDEFEKKVSLAKQKMERNVADYRLVKIYDENLEKIESVLTPILQITDCIGKGKDGSLYVLLNDVRDEDLKALIQKLTIQEIACESMSLEE